MRLATSVLAAALLAPAAPADAGVNFDIHVRIGDGHRHDYGRGGYGHRSGSRYDPFRIGYDRGYAEGLRHGIDDGRKHRDYNYWHDRDYRRGERGYHHEFGPRHVYVDGFRLGYEEGYRRGFGGTRHRHHGRSGWCHARHHQRYAYDRDDDGRHGYGDRRRGRDDRYDDDRIIYERRRY